MDKKEQRKQGIKARKSLVMAEEYSKKICDSLLNSQFYQNADTIFSYVPFNGEVDISYFNQCATDDGKTVAYPICGSDGSMVAAVPDSETAWECGKYGIMTPILDVSHILEPNEIDVVIVPCTAFDPESRIRIGMGAGYYDRYLPKCKTAKSIAVAFEVQKIEGLCIDEWDYPLDAIVTELFWYYFSLAHNL